MANRGDVRPFVRFIAECTERTLDLFLWATTEYAHEFPALETRKLPSRTIFVQEPEHKEDKEADADVEASSCPSSSDCDGFD